MTAPARLLTFDSPLGWIGVAHHTNVIFEVKFGTDSEHDLISLFTIKHDRSVRLTQQEEELTTLLCRYASGEVVDFSGLRVSLDHLSPFQARVIECCRLIPHGETLSYGELAKQAGSPQAARAVGSVMKKNRAPLIVPCHRVCSRHGLGGYSAGSGAATKRQLLDLEQPSGLFELP